MEKNSTIFQCSLISCNFLLKWTFWILLDVFFKFRCCVFDFFNFRTLLTWIFCPPSQSGCQHRITGRSVGMVSNHLHRSSCWQDLWTEVGDIGLVTSWYVKLMVLLQSLTVWWKCCVIPTGRSVSWHDSETHLQLVSPDLGTRHWCINRSTWHDRLYT